MLKRFIMIQIILIIGLVLLLPGCGGGSNKNADKQNVKQEGPAPDYTQIEKALKDPSDDVKKSAVKMLSKIKHSSTIPIYINIIKDNTNNSSLVSSSTKSLITYKEKAVQPVKEELWDTKKVDYQVIALKIFMSAPSNEELYNNITNTFFETPYNEGNTKLRRLMSDYIIKNIDPNNGAALSDMLVMLIDPDKDVANKASIALADIKSPKIFDKLIQTHESNRDNDELTKMILSVLLSYPKPNNKIDPPIPDISIFFDTFGSKDEEIQNLSYSGINKYAFNDPDGKIMEYIKSFESCDSELVRSHMYNLIVNLQKVKKRYPKDKKPVFTFPKARNNNKFCK